VGIYNVAPGQVAAAQTLHEHLRRRHVRGEGNAVSVAEAGNVVYIVLPLYVVGVTEKQNQVNFIVRNSRAYLLRSPLTCGKAGNYRQSCGFAYKLAGGFRSADGVSRENAAVCYAKLYHELFFTVMRQKSNVQSTTPFPLYKNIFSG